MESLKENLKNAPLYKFDNTYAAKFSEEDLLGESTAANIACSHFLEGTVEASYNSELHHPDYDGAIERAVARFGAPRVQYVIANAVLRRMHDGRIDQKYKDWAKEIGVAEVHDGSYLVNRLFALNALHSCYIHCLAMNASRM